MSQSPEQPANVRFCPLCRQADDHPRHEIATLPPNTAPHMDCCKAAGCPDGSCDIVTEGAEKLRGDKFRAHLVDNGDKHTELLEQRSADVQHFTTADIAHLGAQSGPINLQGVQQ